MRRFCLTKVSAGTAGFASDNGPTLRLLRPAKSPSFKSDNTFALFCVTGSDGPIRCCAGFCAGRLIAQDPDSRHRFPISCLDRRADAE